MTTNNHTAISTGAAANASTINTPLGELDAAIGNRATLGIAGTPSIVSAIGTAAMTTTAQTLIGAINEIYTDVYTSMDTDGTLKANAVDTAAVIVDGILTNAKLDDDIKIGSLANLWTQQKTSVEVAANELKALVCFDRYNGTGSTIATALRVLGAIRHIRIFGSFDKTKPHKVYLMARNSATINYQIIIDIFDGSTWRRLIDTGNAFAVTENANGLTYVRIDPDDNVNGYVSAYGQTKAGCELVIDYSQLTDTATYTIDAIENTAPNYVIRPEFVDDALLRENEHILWDVFTGYPNTQNIYTTIGGGMARRSIIDVAIYGSDKTKPHKVWLIARGPGAPQNWRIIVYRNDGTIASPTWTKIIDPGDNFSVTENTGGITVVYISTADNILGSTGVSARFWIDYQWLTASTSYNFEAAGTNDPVLVLRPRCIFSTEGVDADNYFDQDLNTTDAVDFASVTTTGNVVAGGDVSGGAASFTTFQVAGTLPSGTLASPPGGLLAGDMWADTTDSATHPILRVKA